MAFVAVVEASVVAEPVQGAFDGLAVASGAAVGTWMRRHNPAWVHWVNRRCVALVRGVMPEDVVWSRGCVR
ncbi:hypothetical protein GCM10010492_03540 [Saccharothrix mutabilis subsp. mutabilis]|uniref:Uncharacterized protein n=1 Tax=Saccharothrix mutabilis subsp. mutabilis TaxID=66855 RepID=A0ABP3CLU9_9PSEU